MKLLDFLIFLEKEHGKMRTITGVIGSIALLAAGLMLIWLGIAVSIFAINNLFF